MNIGADEIEFTDVDLKEVFALFSSPTRYELNQIDDPMNPHFFRNVELEQNYELSYSKKDFAEDAIRSVLVYLHRHNYRLEKDGNVLALDPIIEYFA